MRILALLFGAMAVTVWWAPLPRFAQSLVLILLCVTLLAVRSAQKRLDVAHEATLEAKEILRQVREDAGSTP
jgi:hypothetical protein